MLRWFVLLAFLLAPAASAAAGFEARHVGAVSEGLEAPVSMVVRGDRIAVLEPHASRILVYSADGPLVRRLDISTDALGLVALPGGRYVFLDRARGSARWISIADGEQGDFLGGEDLVQPTDLVAAGESILVLDPGAGSILVAGSDGTLRDRIAIPEFDGAPLGFPSAIAADPDRDRIYLLDQLTSTVHVVRGDGAAAESFCGFGSDPGTVTRGGDLACDAEGLIYITDRFQGRIAVFSPDREFLGEVRTDDLGHDRLDVPTGLAVGDDGLVYVASTEGSRIHILEPRLTGEPTASIDVRLLAPAAGSTVGVDAVVFEVEMSARGELPVEPTLDFELAEAGASPRVLETLSGITAAGVVESGGFRTWTAAWRAGNALEPDTEYVWRVRGVMGREAGTWTGWSTFLTEGDALRFRLLQNRPNPFRPSTVIGFVLDEPAAVSLEVFDLLGRQVWRRTFDDLGPGRHETVWDAVRSDGTRAAPGVYFYRLIAGSRTETRKMVLAR